MGKHFFHETTTTVKDSNFYRLIYCEWCGLVAWHFNKSDNGELQAQVGNECNANNQSERGE